MKTKLSLMVGTAFLLGQMGIALAGTSTVTLTASAAIPAASGISISFTPISGNKTTGTTTTTSSNSKMDFGTLTYNTTLGTWGPSATSPAYFIVDVASNGTGATPAATLTYTEGTAGAGNPNGIAATGLGSKLSVSMVTTSGSGTNTKDSPAIVNSKANAVSNASWGTVPAGSWQRAYVGLCTGNTDSSKGTIDPSGCGVFTNSDKAGTYTGTLSFTATVA